MSKNPFVQQGKPKAAKEPFCLAVVVDVNANGATLQLAGSDKPTVKRSKVLSSASVRAGDRVLCARTTETSFIVLGKF